MDITDEIIHEDINEYLTQESSEKINDNNDRLLELEESLRMVQDDESEAQTAQGEVTQDDMTECDITADKISKEDSGLRK